MGVYTMVTMKQAIKEVETIIEEYKPLMKLEGWNIFIKTKPFKEGCYLEVMFDSSEYKICTISIYPEYLTIKDKKEREATVIHELVHIKLDKLIDVQNKYINVLQEFYLKMFDYVHEETTEDIAQVLVKMRYKK